MTALQMTFPIMSTRIRAHSIPWRDLVRSLYAQFEPGGLRPRALETSVPISDTGAHDPGLARPIVWAKRAVLLVDIVESVRLIEQDETGAISRWLAFVEHVRTRILPEWKGRVVKSLGDGLLLDFDDVRAAVAAAFAIQQASNRHNTGLPPERQMHLRMGLEVSDVVVEADDVHGRGVNLAARLMSLAGPGEIVVSAHARDQLTADLDAEIEDLGDCFVRHVSHPVRAYRVGRPGPRPIMRPVLPSDDLAPFIAIVPFAARSGGEEHDVVGEVLAEELIRGMSHSSDLNVISRLSTTAFRGRLVTLAEISTHLNADYVLSGTYSASGQSLTLDIELAEAKSGRVAWADRIRDNVSAILSGDSDFVDRVIVEVSAAIMTRELQRAQTQPLPTLKAYTLLLGAIALMHRLSRDDFTRARELLQALIERGVRHSVPHAWLAHWYVLNVNQGWSADVRHDQHMAVETAKRALDADSSCSLALASEGSVNVHFLKRLDVAQQRYDQAVAANPNNALAWLLKGTLHAFMDEGSHAVQCTERARLLSPLDPKRWYYDSLAASACVTAGHYQRAHDLALSSLRANRQHTSTLRVLAVTQWQLGFREEARKTCQDLMAQEPNLTVGRWLARHPGADSASGREFARMLKLVGVPE
jgi:class 3 adenylate cyclase/tetratricopeptide (TPR) repeat protein